MREVGTNDLIDDSSDESCNQLRQRRDCLIDARRYILNREKKLTASPFNVTPLSAIHHLITENRGAIAKVMREFHHVHKGGMDDRSTALWDRHLSLEQ
jgi:hypothetical protein